MLIVIDVVAVTAVCTAVLVYSKKPNRAAWWFGAAYFTMHLGWFPYFQDAFIPLFCAVSAILGALYLSSYEPLGVRFDNMSVEARIAFLQERIARVKHVINVLFAGAVAVSGSALAFNYEFMEKTFQAAQSADTKLALHDAQRLIATTLIWNVLLLVGFVLPRMYGRIDTLTDMMKAPVR